MYQNSSVDRLRKSKLALCQCSGGLLASLAIITVVAIALSLTTIGVMKHEQQYDTHKVQLDQMVFRYKWCHDCEPFRDTVVCSRCEPGVRFSEQERQLQELTRQESKVAIHEALGFLWNWMGITWPTLLLSTWVDRLLSISSRVALANMALTCLWVVYMVVKRLLLRQMESFQTALAVADQTAPAGFKPPPTVDELLAQQATHLPMTAVDDYPPSYNVVSRRVRFQV